VPREKLGKVALGANGFGEDDCFAIASTRDDFIEHLRQDAYQPFALRIRADRGGEIPITSQLLNLCRDLSRVERLDQSDAVLLTIPLAAIQPLCDFVCRVDIIDELSEPTLLGFQALIALSRVLTSATVDDPKILRNTRVMSAFGLLPKRAVSFRCK